MEKAFNIISPTAIYYKCRLRLSKYEVKLMYDLFTFLFGVGVGGAVYYSFGLAIATDGISVFQKGILYYFIFLPLSTYTQFLKSIYLV